ncbi:hypothetical protein GCM10011487_47200 [Steroidobacter agaridevorans]|uniref:Uncharacterized protein n=1 Tax=Steroidobacter agaridevorans TaxID=2695856 RepID=A0A829YHL2_9GAMM|nr:hypothetical protein [Steroidobacter agaridevorans]GFE82720.1 hypothetical protein GCM10011487_47200 [Steroidobacter agaridevorans]
MLDLLQDMTTRLWHDLLARPSGPFAFRFLLQPTMAAIAAIRAGIVDARTGRSPYFLALWTEPAERKARLREGVSATLRIFLLGLVMDTVYQFVVLKKFYPLEALIVSVVLAVVPYFLIRGPAARVARWRQSRHAAHHRAVHR